MEQPYFGFKFTVQCEVKYQLIKIKTSKMIYNKAIKTNYTAQFTDAFLATTRLRLANEGAARANIMAMIRDLYKLNIKSGVGM